ncbi:RING-H2 finger protein ATL47-like [Cryptomeria japonica]|uniref:RING-H2 finger protein ATL47-like n=1 Tax=Cryptomeria japonica TaxID=3369 RepID=UPI0027DA2500|nr:RING-H2 finger protein ATL47-like [Cryptomeria japonica]
MDKVGIMAPWSASHTDIEDRNYFVFFVISVILIISIGVILFLFDFFWRLYRANQSSSWIQQTEEEEEQYQTDNGLDKQLIEALLVFVYKEESFKNNEEKQLMCVICCSKFKQNEKGRELPKCNHRFHVNCVDKWLELQSTCPLCRINVEDAISDEQERIEEGESESFSTVGDDNIIDVRESRRE